MLYKLEYKSPIGIIHIEGTEQAISSIMFSDEDPNSFCEHKSVPKVLSDCYEQLDEYFKGERKEFTFPYVYTGTEFQQAVWSALSSVPFAKTCSYQEIASEIGKEKAVRAVGTANGRNRLSIVIPCHRVIGSNGKLTGYAGGLWRKEWLLQHEKQNNV